MSTSLLYHVFGIRGYELIRTEFTGGRIHVHVRRPREDLRCAVCLSSEVVLRGTVLREFFAPPIGLKLVVIVLEVQRLECRECGALRQDRVDFAVPRRRFIRAFARYALALCRVMTMKDVAAHLGVGWDLIKDLQKRDLQRRFGRLKLKKVRRIAIDEIAVGKGHHYLTIVMDLDTGAVVYIGKGKGADALDGLWTARRRCKAKIHAVAMDMSEAYITAVRTHLPKAEIVFDPFHVVKLMNDKLSQLRRDLYHQANQEGKQILKGSRWLLLKAPENLDQSRAEWPRLEQALALNHPLATAYYLKEELRLFWREPDKKRAADILSTWLERAQTTGIGVLRTMAETLQACHRGLLAQWDWHISTGPLEGLNNKIQTMKRQAYGFRDREFYKLKILAIHEAKFALVG